MSVESKALPNESERTIDRQPLHVGEWVFATRIVNDFPVQLCLINGKIVRQEVKKAVSQTVRGRLAQTPMETPSTVVTKPGSEGPPAAVPVSRVFRLQDVRVVEHAGEFCYAPEADIILNPEQGNFTIERAPTPFETEMGGPDQLIPLQRTAS